MIVSLLALMLTAAPVAAPNTEDEAKDKAAVTAPLPPSVVIARATKQVFSRASGCKECLRTVLVVEGERSAQYDPKRCLANPTVFKYISRDMRSYKGYLAKAIIQIDKKRWFQTVLVTASGLEENEGPSIVEGNLCVGAETTINGISIISLTAKDIMEPTTQNTAAKAGMLQQLSRKIANPFGADVESRILLEILSSPEGATVTIPSVSGKLKTNTAISIPKSFQANVVVNYGKRTMKLSECAVKGAEDNKKYSYSCIFPK